MLKAAFAATALWVAFAAGAVAEQRAVVVELFTSQGCSSCPPADAVLAQLADRDDVIPLALHVDYWDYIGWKDRFADPANTKRQKGYARAKQWRIYTPQMVIGGADVVVGSRAMKVAETIRDHANQPAKVDLSIERKGNRLVIHGVPLRAGSGKPCDIHVVRYRPAETVPIRAGENAGHKLTYTHIVQSWETVGTWDGSGAFEATVRVRGDEPVVVLLQEPGYGPIVAAARLR